MTDRRQRQILPEVQAYITARDAARQAWRATEQTFHRKYLHLHDDNGPTLEGQRAHYEERQAAQEAFQAADIAAWNELAKSSDPLVCWIAKHCLGHRGPATEILAALPATLERLEAIAADGNWCHIWIDLRDKAISDGVISDIRPGEARKALLEWLDGEMCCGLDGRQRIELDGRLDTLLTEEKAGVAG